MQPLTAGAKRAPLKSAATLSLCLATVLMAGCPQFEPRERTVVFSFAEGGALKRTVLQEQASAFEARHPDTRVYLHGLPPSTDDQRVFYLSSLGARSNFVDVFEADVIWTAEFAAAGLLLDLTSRAALGRQERFVAPLLRQARYRGRVYGAPYYATFGALFYRADLLRKHGLTAPTTLKELVAQARRVGQAEAMDGLLFPAADYEGLTCTFLEFYACHGPPIRAKDERVVLKLEAVEATLQFMVDAVQKHKITPTAALAQIEADQTEAFRDGEAVFMRSWYGARRYLRQRLSAKQIGVMALPASRGALSGGFLLAVNRRTEVPKLALELVAQLTRPAAQRRLASLRGQGPALATLHREQTAQGGPPAGTLQRSVTRPQSPYYFELSQIITQETRAALHGHRSAAAAARRLVQRCKDLRLARQAPPSFPKTNYMTRYRP